MTPQEITKLISQCDGFEWDKGNLDKNWIKHGVEAIEAEDIFRNNEALYFKDEKHSIKEERYSVIGLTPRGRELFVTFTVRNSKIRVISARDANEKEIQFYEQTIQGNTEL